MKAGLDLWAALVAAVLKEADAAGTLKSPLEHERLAGFIVNAWEGAALRAKVTRSREPLDDFFAMLDTFVT